MLYIIVAIVSWGLWAVAEKLALRDGSPLAVMMVTSWVYACSVPFLALGMAVRNDNTPLGSWVGWTIIAAILGLVANMCFLSALNIRPTSEVVSYTQLYPLVTYLLCFVFLGEKLTVEKAVGAVLMLAGAFIMNR